MTPAVQLFLLGSGWVEMRDGDESCRAIFERHYSRYRYADGRKPKLILGPGQKLLLMRWGYCFHQAGWSFAAVTKSAA